MGGATKRPKQRRDLGFWENLCGTGRNDRAPGEITEEMGSDDDDGDQVSLSYVITEEPGGAGPVSGAAPISDATIAGS